MTPVRISIVVFLLSLLITQVIAFKIAGTEKANEQLLVEQEAVNVKTKLLESLNHSITATRILAYLMENDLVDENFTSVSRELVAQNPFIDALQYVVGSSIVDTYPREGNEPTIGYRVMEQRSHKQGAMKALERGDLYFEGPIELIQGGIGVVGRYPVIKNGDLYGFSAVVIHLETIYSALSLDSSGITGRFIYQIYKQEDGSPIPFFTNDELFESGLVHSGFIPLGNWNINVKLSNPSYLWQGLVISGAGLLFSLLLALFVAYLASEPKRLQELVDKKTSDLEKSKIQLEDYNTRLRQSNSELENFTRTISQDLQEPLRMISSFMRQLKKKYGDTLDGKAHTYIDYAMDGAENMRLIILDLLVYSKIGQNMDQRKSVDLNRLVGNLEIELKKIISENNASITYPDLPEIYGLEYEIHLLFQNLITNALRYRHPDRSPEIAISQNGTDSVWKFGIADNGIGINGEHFEKIFQVFQRLHTEGNYRGTGLGLAICKKIVEQHSGNIWVESEPGKGSTFYFTLKKEAGAGQG